MMKSLVALLFLSLCALSLCENVVTLTSENFDSTIADNEFVLVEFYAPWCGHCKTLAPEYETAAGVLGDRAVLAKVDATEERALGEKFGVRGFPTLKFFRQGAERDYTGGRTSDEIVSWVKKATGPPTTNVDTEAEAETFFEDNEERAVLGFFDDREGEAFKAFEKFAGASDQFAFATVVDSDLAAQFGLTNVNTFMIRRSFGEDVVSEDTDDFSLGEWLDEHGYPLVDDISQETYARLMDAGKPFGIVFLTFDETKEGHVEWVTELAEKYKGKFSFTIADGVQFKRAITGMGGSGDVIPIMQTLRPDLGEDRPPMAWDESVEFNKENTDAWVASVLDGTAKSWQKSEPVPESNDGPVTVLVGKTIGDVINDESKNVFVEFYAPWCGHCKSLAPIYEKLGEAFADQENVVIAKMDATANAVPENLSVQGFPTLILFTKDNKEGITFEGDRTLAAMTKFILEKGDDVTPVDVGDDGSEPPEDEDEEDWGEDEEGDEKDEL